MSNALKTRLKIDLEDGIERIFQNKEFVKAKAGQVIKHQQYGSIKKSCHE